jgi:Icc protein
MAMEQANAKVTRRGIIRAGMVAGVGIATGAARGAETRGKAFRVAHLSDMHVVPGPTRSGEGFAMALRSLEKLSPRPDLLITGGDHVMDSLKTNHDKLDPMWDLYTKTLKANTNLPAHPVIGNHDVLGWEAPDQIAPSTAGYGKALYCEKMGIEKPYYSFDAGGWHFICLDNIAHADPSGYVANFDEAQDAWLKDDLENTPKQTPICMITHIPLLAVCTYFFSPFKGKAYNVSDAMMHHDSHRVIALLGKYNVKLCISGHVHMVDRIEYLGITFICDGAVSGNWWKGKHFEFDEGYGIFDFYPDGTFEHAYHAYGWKATM